MGVGEVIALGRVLGVLEVILHLTFRFGSLMHELNEVGVGLEVGNILDGMIEAIQEACHSLLAQQLIKLKFSKSKNIIL